MGNCIMKESSRKRSGEDGSFLDDNCRNLTDNDTDQEKSTLLGESKAPVLLSSSSSSSSSSPSLSTGTDQVKIKISKKQLQQLLKKADVQGLSVQQVLGQLMNANYHFEAHQRSWSPALQSIPE